MTQRHSEAAFETVIEAHLLANGYVTVDRDGFDRERAIFPGVILDFILASKGTGPAVGPYLAGQLGYTHNSFSIYAQSKRDASPVYPNTLLLPAPR